jgi:beta-lysine N6-acetyltransferase
LHTTYYINRKIEQQRFQAEVCFDYYNERLRVDEYLGNVTELGNWLETAVSENSFQKLIVKSKKEHMAHWLKNGFLFEGEFTGYFNGSSAMAMCKYYNNDRRNSQYWLEEDNILRDVQSLKKGNADHSLPDGYILRMAAEDDAKDLSDLYSKVFEIYPTPMNDSEYVKLMIQSGTLFCLITHQDRIISAASADVNADFHNAEITDCATLPDHRKFGLMKHLIDRLEKELYERKIYCSYSIARALSFGMNAVFFQRGYTFTGRLANNCKIFDKYEDMNIWVKDLSV